MLAGASLIQNGLSYLLLLLLDGIICAGPPSHAQRRVRIRALAADDFINATIRVSALDEIPSTADKRISYLNRVHRSGKRASSFEAADNPSVPGVEALLLSNEERLVGATRAVAYLEPCQRLLPGELGLRIILMGRETLSPAVGARYK